MNDRQDELKAIRDVAEKYRMEGYAVQVEPSSEALPPSVRYYQPDIIATRGGENVAIEVKFYFPYSKREYFRKLAQDFRELPGWRLDLVAVERSKQKEAAKPMVSEFVEKRLRTVDVTAEHVDYDAATVLLWTVVVVVLRGVVDQEEMPDLRLVKTAYSDGLISKKQMEMLLNMWRMRNEAAHASGNVSVSESEYKKVRALVEQLVQKLVSGPQQTKS